MLHADVDNLEFLGKSATDPKYCLLFVDLFTSKVYVYPMKSRKSILNKMEIFYKEVKDKRKGQKTRLQTNQEFKQKKIFDLNKKYNVDIFSTAVRGEKAFAAEQKLQELKKRIFRLKAMKKRLSKKPNPYKIIKKSVDNMNSFPCAKYKQTPNEIEKNSLNSEASKERFNFNFKLEKKTLDKKSLTGKFTRKKN